MSIIAKNMGKRVIMFKSMQKRIFLGYLLLTYSLFFLSFFILYELQTRNLLDQAISSSMDLNEVYAEQMGDVIEKKIDALRTIASTQNQGIEHDDITGQLQKLVENNHYGFLTAFYIDASGKVFFSNGETNDSSDRDYFLEMMNKQPGYVISRPIIGRESKREVFVIGVPLKVKGKLIAMVGGSTDLREISTIINENKMPLNSYAWIVDAGGLVVAHPNQSIRMTTNLDETKQYVSQEGHSIWTYMENNQSGFVQYTDQNQNKEKVLTFYEIENTAGWKLGITTLMSDINEPIQYFRTVIFIIATFALVLFAWVNQKFSSEMVRPIIELTQAVSSSEGHINKLDIDVSNDEIGVLVNAYNEMADKIDSHTQNLEKLVEERTRELVKLTEKLENRNSLLTKSNTELYSMANTDQLTGLLNRRFIIGEVETLIHLVEKGDVNDFSVLFLDLDNFKYYNDTFGHNVGDNLLIAVSSMLKNHFRASDIVGRYGGDEFIVILPGVQAEQAQEAAEKISTLFNEKDGFITEVAKWLDTDIDALQLDKYLYCSCGVISYKELALKDADSLLKEADNRMYQQKKEHKANA